MCNTILTSNHLIQFYNNLLINKLKKTLLHPLSPSQVTNWIY